MSDEKRDKELPRIRLTATELSKIRKQAGEAELTLSEYVRQICVVDRHGMLTP